MGRIELAVRRFLGIPSQMKVFSDQPASDLIEDLVCGYGTPVNNCEHCGRVHYDSTGEFMEPGELAELKRHAKEEPEKYIPHDGTVHWGWACGKQTVIGCPCNFLGWFENLIWKNRQGISQYLRKKSAALLNEAQQTKDLASETAIVEKT